MSSTEKLLSLADRFEHKVAQTQGAQAGDIENALKEAGLWVSSDTIAPLLNTARVPANVALNISVVVDKGLNVKFQVDATPPHPSSASLKQLLERAYSNKMSQALKNAKLSVTDTVTAGLAQFA